MSTLFSLTFAALITVILYININLPKYKDIISFINNRITNTDNFGKLFAKPLNYMANKEKEKEKTNEIIENKEIIIGDSQEHRFLNDNVSENDYLGFESYVLGFEFLIKNCDMFVDLPIVIGIKGKWGSGKSTFLKQLKSKLSANYKNIIEINAWQYENERNFISVFLEELHKCTKNKLSSVITEGQKKTIKAVLKEILKSMKISKETLGLKLELDLSKINTNNIRSGKFDMSEIFIRNFESKLKINKILDNELFNEKVIIMIDDLDRCSPENIVNVLQAMRTILDSKNCIFFISYDYDYIRLAIASYYEKYINNMNILNDNPSEKAEKINTFVNTYLEKFIQIPFDLQSSKQIFTFINSVLEHKNSRTIPTEKNANPQSLYKQFIKGINKSESKKLINTLELSPRSAKRFLSIAFIKYLFIYFKLNEEEVDVSLIIALEIIRENDPVFYENNLKDNSNAMNTFIDVLSYREMDGYDDSKNNKYLNIYLSNISNEEELHEHLVNLSTYLSIEKTIDTSQIINEVACGLAMNRDGNSNLYELKNQQKTASHSAVYEHSDSYDFVDSRITKFRKTIPISGVIGSFVDQFFQKVYINRKHEIGLRSGLYLYMTGDDDVTNRFILAMEYHNSTKELTINFNYNNKGKTYKSVLNYMQNRLLEPITINEKMNEIEVKEILENLRELIIYL